MGRKAPALNVHYSSSANREIQKIWDYNAAFYASADHATNYITFLYDQIDRLATEYLNVGG